LAAKIALAVRMDVFRNVGEDKTKEALQMKQWLADQIHKKSTPKPQPQPNYEDSSPNASLWQM